MKAANLLLTLIIISYSNKTILAQCSTAGPRTAGTVTNNSSIGTIAWSGSGNISTSNNSYASASIALGVFSSATSNYMWANNFGFTIPTGAVICGVVVQVERSAGGLGLGSSISDQTVRLVQGGSIVGNNKAIGTAWGGSDATVSYGASNDLWGSTWTASDFNASNFGLVIATQFSTGIAALTLSSNIDYVAVTVHYQVLTPVGYKNLSATAISGGRVSIKWETSFEKDNDFFVVERNNAGSWQKLTQIMPSKLNTNGAKYEVIDPLPSVMNEYRIKQVDVNGRFGISNVVTARVDQPSFQFSIAPNPVAEILTMKWNAPLKFIQIHNEAGLLIQAIPINSNSRNMMVSTANLKKGIYYLRFTGEGYSYNKSFVRL